MMYLASSLSRLKKEKVCAMRWISRVLYVGDVFSYSFQKSMVGSPDHPRESVQDTGLLWNLPACAEPPCAEPPRMGSAQRCQAEDWESCFLSLTFFCEPTSTCWEASCLYFTSLEGVFLKSHIKGFTRSLYVGGVARVVSVQSWMAHQNQVRFSSERLLELESTEDWSMDIRKLISEHLLSSGNSSARSVLDKVHFTWPFTFCTSDLFISQASKVMD